MADEDVAALKKSCNGYLGVMSRYYKELEVLFTDPKNYDEVLKKTSELQGIFESYESKCKVYISKLPEKEAEGASERLEHERKNKLEFEKRLAEWMQTVAKVTEPETSIQKEVDAISVRSAQSTTSSVRLKEAQAKRALAALKREQLEKTQRLQEQQLKLEQELERLNVEHEIINAEAELQVWEEEEVLQTGSELKRGKDQSPAGNSNIADKQSEKPNELCSTLNPNAPEYAGGQSVLPEISGTTQIEPQPDGGLSQIMKTLNMSINMPKPDLQVFRGDPSDYYTFINNFETSVANKLSEDRQKLTYLLQFCGGDAKDSIACCVLMDSSSGYRKAREILAQQFGQPHVVAHSLIDKVVNRPAIKPNEYKSLAELSRQMRKCEVTLSQSGYTADLNSTDTLIKIQQLLPMYMKKEWAKRAQNQIGRNIVPNFRHMTDFVEEHARIANNIFGRSISGKRETQSHGMSSGGQRLTTLSTQSTSGREMPKRNPRKCACCSGDHPIDNCKELRDKPQKERFKFVRRNRLCDNCLKPNHVASKCRYPPGCQVEGCGRRHHTLIHFIRSESQSEQTQMGAGGGSESQVQDVGTSASVITSQKVCLRVLPVKVRGNGREVTTMALLDQGSDTTLCAKALAKELGFSEGERQFEINTVNGPSKVKYGSEISLSIQGACEEGIIEIPAVWTVDQLPVSERSIPRQEDIQGYSHLKGITLSVCNKEVRLLIGSDTPEAFWVQEERRGGAKEPYAVRTPLGWTLLGPMSHMKERKVCITVHHVSQDSLQTQLKRFWELDHLCGDSGEKQGESQEDRKARSMMEKSAVLVEGHYEIALPWRHYPPEMPENWNMAVSRMQSLGRRLERDGNLQVLYKAEIDAYVKRGYAREVASEDVGERGRVWYLPHHAVTHPAKPGRVRVVFDCAAQQRGISLNKRLLQGPDHTNNLIGVLTRFRQEKIALVADIESMFSQVRVSPGDTDFLRFLWWQDGDPSKPLKKYQMLVHLFGATSSPSCAGFALQKTAEDNREKYPGEVYQSVQDNFYVDDYLGCASTKGDAIILMKNLCHMLKAGGFRLTKWGSNDKEVLSEVPTAERAASLIDLDLDHLPVGRTLGVLWDIEKDMFTFGVSVEDVPTTRRGILSATSSLFDPLGFIAPYTLEAKFLLQDLCAKGLGWDEYVGDDELQRWKGWLAELSDLQQVEISRCFMPSSFDGETFDLHLFSDASERGYAASAYMRISNEKGEVHCVFVLGKARLCPLKRITIPRLELSAALLAVKLSQVIKDELRMPISSVTYWTDSTAVLMYIRNESRRFKTFVANRVAKIREATEVTQWRYVPTNLNPADDGSRGLHAWELTQDSRWLNGPDFLWKEKDVWPATPEGVTRGKLQENEDLLQEVKSTASQSFMSESKGSISSWLERYSSWTRLKRGVAWVLRYKKYLLAKLKRQLYKPEKILTVPELQQAEREIVKYIQRDVFEDEIKMARRGKDERLGKNSALRKLNPILVDEILRVGGRLKNAPVNDDVKHPVVMPSDHHVTRLIVVHYHRLIGHSGSGMTWAAVRNKYWILRGGATVRHVIGKCLECRKRNAVCGQQLMGELPAERVTPNKPPFAYVGIDYFGPLYIKQGRSQVKRWGCVFTCLTVRAVHIELAESLSTDSFINALRRFISRRGPPEKVFSDNGSNFKSGEKELREALRELNDMKVGDYLHQREIEWHFNPPTGSHMGGIWERVIRSVRQILKGLLKEQIVNQEVLTTVVAEVEAILNSRPLTQISLDPADAEPLTPNHLLLMRKSPNVPPGLFTKADGYGRRQWRQSQYLANQFWRRWVKEYLPLLQVRQKWQKRSRNFQVNDLVLVAEDGVPRGQWSVGRVERVFPDEGGNVRQVEVRLGQKVYRRPIVKLCLLEGCDERL